MKSPGALTAFKAAAILLMAVAPHAHAYTYSILKRSPADAFVGQQVGVTLQFTLETRNAPPGVISNSELFRGNVNFGNGIARDYSAFVATPRDGYSQATITRSAVYDATGIFTINTTGTVRDRVCTEAECFTTDRGIAPMSRSVIIYSPSTTMEAVQLALSVGKAKLIAAGIRNPSDVDIARAAYGHAITMRTQNSSTSSDPALRDAEYMLRGYAGGLLLRNPSAFTDSILSDTGNDVFNMSGPIGALGYNVRKMFVELTGGSASSDSLPASPPGGIEANWHGFKAGLTGDSPEELGSSTGYNAVISKELSDVQSPIMPDLAIGDPVSGNRAELVSLNVNPDTIYFIDPESANGMAFAVAGNQFRSILLPGSIFGPDGTYRILTEGREFTITPDVEFSITEFFPDGVASFSLLGVPADFPGTVSVGTRFMDYGRVIVGVNEFSMDNRVPEPSTMALMVLLAAIPAAKRLKRKPGSFS